MSYANSADPDQTASKQPTLLVFAYFAAIFTMGKMKIFDCFETNYENKILCA